MNNCEEIFQTLKNLQTTVDKSVNLAFNGSRVQYTIQYVLCTTKNKIYYDIQYNVLYSVSLFCIISLHEFTIFDGWEISDANFRLTPSYKTCFYRKDFQLTATL